MTTHAVPASFAPLPSPRARGQSFSSRGQIITTVITVLGFALILAAQHMLQSSRKVQTTEYASAPQVWIGTPVDTSSSVMHPEPLATSIPQLPMLNPNITSPPPAPMSRANVRPVRGWLEARWLVQGEYKKAGSGILFFAYGGSKRTLRVFLHEAERAGRSFREHNPGISLAVVSNNGSVDYSIFDTHIIPREDLLFAGDTDNGGQKRPDKVPRQWLTRLYYLAHSPYELTWALDSNVFSCTPFAAQTFLSLAHESNLWDYHIAHASQNVLGQGKAQDVMYPHNFNILFMWGEETSALLRDWLLLQLRQGVSSDDQKTLHLAELRFLRRMGNKFKVGRVVPEYGASFYNVIPSDGQLRSDRARVTPVLQGRVHVIHSTNRSLCEVFNSHTGRERQIMGRRRQAGNGPKFIPCTPSSHCVFASLTSHAKCQGILGPDEQYCLLTKDETRATGQTNGADGANATWARNGSVASPLTLAPPVAKVYAFDRSQYITRASLEDYGNYVRSTRCGTLCDHSDIWDLSDRILPNSVLPKLRFSPCRYFPGARLGQFKLMSKRADTMACPAGGLLQMFKLTYQGCSTLGKMHFMYDCARRASSNVRITKVQSTSCNATDRVASVDRLGDLSISCAEGFAISEVTLNPSTCTAEGELTFEYVCSALIGHLVLPKDPKSSGSLQMAAAKRIAAARNSTRGPRAALFTSVTLCTQMAGLDYEALEPHMVHCGPLHALSSFRLTTDGCLYPGFMRIVFSCVGIPESTAPTKVW